MSRRDISLFAGEVSTTDIVLRPPNAAPLTSPTTIYLLPVSGSTDFTVRPIGPLNVVVTFAELEAPSGAAVTPLTRSATQSEVPALLKSIATTKSASTTQTATLTRSTGRILSAIQAQTASLARAVSASRAATQACSAAVSRAMTHVLNAAQTCTA